MTSKNGTMTSFISLTSCFLMTPTLTMKRKVSLKWNKLEVGFLVRLTHFIPIIIIIITADFIYRR